MRVGCKAMIRLLRTKDHAWIVTMFADNHNHQLSEPCGETKQWGPHGSIDPSTKDLIRRLRENRVSIGSLCSILGSSDGLTRSAIQKEAVRSVCARLAQDNIKDDIGKTQAEMKIKDPDMEIRYKVDAEGRINSMLWCTGRNRHDYNLFGDVVTFDTTYRTNLYNMPFGMFVGVNNHFQTVEFGGVLLTNERTEDFEWSFSAFIEIMGGKTPKTFLIGNVSNQFSIHIHPILHLCTQLQPSTITTRRCPLHCRSMSSYGEGLEINNPEC